MAKPPEDDSFLSRWSRRKAEARVEDDTQAPDETQSDAVEAAASAEPVVITEEELAALPKIEDLVPGTDIRAFLRPGVPSSLKDAALRKMWHVTPSIRDYLDPAVDYAWDWNTPGGVPGDGVAPSPERAAQMMRELFAPRPPKEDVPATLEVDADPATSLDTAAADSADGPEPATPVAQTDAKIQEAEYDKSISNQSDTNDAIPRRRHGGALPT